MADKYSLVAFTVENKDKAHELLHKLHDLDVKDENIEIKDAAYAHKVSKGRIKLEQPDDLGGGRGALGGGVIGVIVGTMLAGPLGAAVGGVLGGAVSGLYTKLRDSGVNDKFMKQVSKTVDEGKTVLFLEYSGEISPDMISTLESYNASVIHGTLPAKVESIAVEAVAAEGEEVTPEIEVFTEEATEADIEPVEEVIAPIIAQAAEPAPPVPEEPPAAVVAAAPAPAPEVKVDNLTVIDGIGPKVNKALQVAGITTYDKLAQASEAQMRAAIASVGMVPPKSMDTWPRQARFAAAGEWTELYKFNAKRKVAAKGHS